MRKRWGNRWSIFIISAIFCFLWGEDAQAEVNFINFQNLSSEEGLSQNSVNSILQTKDGLMWFGTYDGLNIYDGYDFRVIKNQPFLENTLSSNVITALAEDEKGNVWIGTIDGLNCYVRQTESYKKYTRQGDEKTNLIDNRVRDLLCNGEKIWIGTNKGLCYYDLKKEVFVPIKDAVYGIEEAKIRDIKKIDDRHLLVTANEGVFLLTEDQVSKKIMPYPDSKENRLKNIVLSAEYQPSTNQLWLGTYEGGLISYQLETGEISYYLNQAEDGVGQIQSLEFEDSLNLWVGTNNRGLILFNTGSRAYRNYFHDSSNSRSLADNDVLKLMKDSQGNMWVGTYSGGISKFSLNRFFEYYNDSDMSKYKLNSAKIHSILKEKNYLYVGTYLGGINRINQKTGVVDYIKNPLVKNDIVRLIYRDTYGEIWVGYENGIFTYDESSGNFQKKIEEIDYNVQVLAQDKGYLWIGTLQGLFQYNLETGQYKKVLEGEDISAILVDEADLWIGTYLNGVIRFNKETGKTQYYKYDIKDHDSISSNSINSIVKDNRGRLWFGTSNGLNVLDYKTGTFKVYTEMQGLSNNNIYCILKDDEGYLWMSTNNGISRFDTHAESFLNFSIRDGLQNTEFNMRSGHKAEDGELFFGGIKGLNAFYPKDIEITNKISPIQFLTFKNNEGNINLADSNHSKIDLSSQANSFEISFAVLDFGDAQTHTYRYRLKGFEEEWKTLKGRNIIQYTNIPGGNYTFELYASNERGTWNQVAKTLEIEVGKVFYKTPEAYLIYVVLVVGALYIGFGFLKVNKEKALEIVIKDVAQKEREVLQTLLDTIPDTILYHTIDGIYLKSNKAFDLFYGVDKTELEGRRVYKYYPENVILEIKKQYENHDINTRLYRSEGEIQDKQGKIHSVIWTRAYVVDKAGEVNGIISVATDITDRKLIEEELWVSQEKLMLVNNALKSSNLELELANQKLEEMSMLDPLTQVPNRRHFEKMLIKEWARAARHHLNMAIMIIDIDYFKEYNDNYGHLLGDDCIMQVAQTIQASLKRGGDILARYGGDEFIVVLPETDREGASIVAQNIMANIKQLKIMHLYSKVSNEITITMGLAITIAEEGQSMLALIKQADEALYEAKNNGRNQYKIYSKTAEVEK